MVVCLNDQLVMVGRTYTICEEAPNNSLGRPGYHVSRVGHRSRMPPRATYCRFALGRCVVYLWSKVLPTPGSPRCWTKAHLAHRRAVFLPPPMLVTGHGGTLGRGSPGVGRNNALARGAIPRNNCRLGQFSYKSTTYGFFWQTAKLLSGTCLTRTIGGDFVTSKYGAGLMQS